MLVRNLKFVKLVLKLCCPGDQIHPGGKEWQLCPGMNLHAKSQLSSTPQSTVYLNMIMKLMADSKYEIKNYLYITLDINIDNLLVNNN